MPHFLDETGNIPKQMPREARELGSFMALVVDTTTISCPKTLTLTDIRCFKKKCEGLIKSEITDKNDDVHWVCSKCPNEGLISKWQNTKWDNKNNKKPL